jgi:peptidoglycan/LPS O-acetylase OafA/YrhL
LIFAGERFVHWRNDESKDARPSGSPAAELFVNGRESVMKYHPEIDGLRAVSVMSVVFYHVGYAWMPGGFIGVDVFFVISGFLITGLLVENHDRGRPSLFDFYIRRMRRLGPALLMLVALCMIAGYFMLSPGDYEVLGLSSLYTLFASSNFYFLYNTGYFDVSSQSIALLHTWSLAVEEQFYLVWPLALWLILKVFRNDRSKMLIAVAGLAFVSFGSNLYAVGTQEMSGFYLAQNRAWELLIGAALALWGRDPTRPPPRILLEALPFLGLCAILYAATAFTKGNAYPGFRAALPVLGAAAFLLPVGHNTLMYRLLGSRIPVLVGKASYSIYLYHWPILVFWLHYSSFEPLTGLQRLVLVVVSCAAAFLSWNYIEKPFRQGTAPPRRVAAAFAMSTLALAAAGSFVIVRAGVPDRLPASVRALASLTVMWSYDGCRPSNSDCETGRPWADAKYRIVLIGDSNAVHFVPELAAAAEGHDVSIWFFGGCSPVHDGDRTLYYDHPDPAYNQECKKSRDRVLAALHSEVTKVSMVVFSSVERGSSHGAELR